MVLVSRHSIENCSIAWPIDLYKSISDALFQLSYSIFIKSVIHSAKRVHHRLSIKDEMFSKHCNTAYTSEGSLTCKHNLCCHEFILTLPGQTMMLYFSIYIEIITYISTIWFLNLRISQLCCEAHSDVIINEDKWIFTNIVKTFQSVRTEPSRKACFLTYMLT